MMLRGVCDWDCRGVGKYRRSSLPRCRTYIGVVPEQTHHELLEQRELPGEKECDGGHCGEDLMKAVTSVIAAGAVGDLGVDVPAYAGHVVHHFVNYGSQTEHQQPDERRRELRQAKVVC